MQQCDQLFLLWHYYTLACSNYGNFFNWLLSLIFVLVFGLPCDRFVQSATFQENFSEATSINLLHCNMICPSSCSN